MAALESYGLLDTPPDAVFDSITQAAANLCETPIALISLIDPKRQWFKSRVGLEIEETSRSVAFCPHAFQIPDAVMEVSDATLDERFSANPLVTSEPNIRFYAGKSLVTKSGHALGTLCVIDRQPRKLSDSQRFGLINLSDAVMTLIEERHNSPISATSRAIEQNIPCGLLITDPNQPGNPIIYCNKAFELLFGYSKKDVLGRNCHFLQGHDTDKTTVEKMRVAIANRADYSTIIKNYKKDGTAFWNELTLTPVRDSSGNAVSYLGIQQDVTARLRMDFERLELQNELAHVSRLTAMGQMATGLAHELNQPLTAITQNADAALSVVSETTIDNALLVTILQDIEFEALRAGDIIRTLRQFLRKEDTLKSKIDLNELVNQTMQLLSADMHANQITFERCSGNIPMIEANRVQILQVLVNLIRNSMDALLDIESLPRMITATTILRDSDVIVSIDDTGPGIESNLELFKSFETTKADGMGLGLSISRSIIETHGGKLWCDTTLGSLGTRMSFSLPIRSI